jgi:hypothetical protein
MRGEPELSDRFGMLEGVTAAKQREWRGVKPVAAPAGVAITTRLHTPPEDENVLDLVAEHLGGLRRADLSRVCRPVPFGPSLNGEAKQRARQDRRNTRKKRLTAESSARWANAIISANDAQYGSARDGHRSHIIGLQAAIATIEKRLAHPTADTLTSEERRTRRKVKLAKGYATQAERYEKQRRLQRLRAQLDRVCADWNDKRVHVVEGGKRLAKTPHHLDGASLTPAEWRDNWGCARYWRAPYENVTRHEAAATVIGRRAQGFKARRRKGVTRTRPEDRVVRATDQAAPDNRPANTRDRHRPGMRGAECRPPRRASTRHLCRATVTPAPANNGRLQE